MTNKPGRTIQSTNRVVREELTLGCTRSGDKGCEYRSANRMPYRIKILPIKRVFCYNPVYLNTPLLIIYLSAIGTLICHTGLLPWFCTKYRIELTVALYSTQFNPFKNNKFQTLPN